MIAFLKQNNRFFPFMVVMIDPHNTPDITYTIGSAPYKKGEDEYQTNSLPKITHEWIFAQFINKVNNTPINPLS